MPKSGGWKKTQGQGDIGDQGRPADAHRATTTGNAAFCCTGSSSMEVNTLVTTILLTVE